MEAVESAIEEGASILLRDVPIRWRRKDNSKQASGLEGTFSLSALLIKECDLNVDFQNCYLCVRMEGLKTENVLDFYDLQSYTWVSHGLTEFSTEVSEEKGGHVDFSIHQATMRDVPEAVLQSRGPFTVEIIPKLLPDIRKEIALNDLNKASELTKNIVLGKQVPDVDMNKKYKTQQSFSIPELPPGLNANQTDAVRKALTQPFTLIQGPPGTGKTVVGVHLVYWFHQMNLEAEPVTYSQSNEGGGTSQPVIMYCGPSNKSVDVVGEKLLGVCKKLRPLRVYSEQMELSEFPYPGSSLRVSGYLREGKPNEKLRSITLHHLIRQPSNPYSRNIREFDQRIRNGEEMTQKEVDTYKDLIRKARTEELRRHDVILCTCVASSNRTLTELPISQLIIDECGMCTEPETLVPLVSHKRVQSIVLIGDHRQLRPVVKNDVCRILKMDHSMFERYEERALLLDPQYRMHVDICAFPSQEFYEKRLRTSSLIRLQPSLFHLGRSCPIVFGEVYGDEQSLVVTSEEGNTNSKANLEEAKEAVRLALLLSRHHVDQKDIAILTPYNAQVAEVSRMLQDQRLDAVTISTIMKSQGSEWRYVIFSTVRSMSAQEIDTRPTFSWWCRNVGFLADPNQINVALTRAKEGLCILGNPRLLRCVPLWKRLLQHYSQRGVVVLSAQIRVAPSTRR